MGDVTTGSPYGGEGNRGIMLDILEPRIVRSAGLEPKLAIELCKPHVGGPKRAVRGMRLYDSDATGFKRPPGDEPEYSER